MGYPFTICYLRKKMAKLNSCLDVKFITSWHGNCFYILEINLLFEFKLWNLAIMVYWFQFFFITEYAYHGNWWEQWCLEIWGCTARIRKWAGQRVEFKARHHLMELGPTQKKGWWRYLIICYRNGLDDYVVFWSTTWKGTNHVKSGWNACTREATKHITLQWLRSLI